MRVEDEGGIPFLCCCLARERERTHQLLLVAFFLSAFFFTLLPKWDRQTCTRKWAQWARVQSNSFFQWIHSCNLCSLSYLSSLLEDPVKMRLVLEKKKKKKQCQFLTHESSCNHHYGKREKEEDLHWLSEKSLWELLSKYHHPDHLSSSPFSLLSFSPA